MSLRNFTIGVVGAVAVWMLAPSAIADAHQDPMLFHRQTEAREGAFTILVPHGWQMEGGIFRVDPTQAGGPAQSLEAKVDLALMKDAAGTVMLRRYPDWYCIDMSQSPAGQMGMFPQGSNYQGMTVAPAPDPQSYLLQYLLPQARPGAGDVQVEESHALDDLARLYRQRLQMLPYPVDFQFQGRAVTVTYQEGGVRYRERLLVLIENRGALAGGQWVNRETLSFRAPADEFAHWEPVFQIISGSVRLSPRWIQGELGGQIQRGQTMTEVQRQVQDLDQQILEHQRLTNAEIQNDAFLTLTEQEEYTNPYTGEIELGTDQLGPHRWVTEGGDVLYAPNEEFDPNTRSEMNRFDWKRSRVRPRGP